MTDDRVLTAMKFLNWQFKAVMNGPEKYYIVIWCFPSKQTYFINDVRAAAVRAIELSDSGQNVYFGLGLHAEPLKDGRGKAADVVAINCVWADIDYEDPEAHKPKAGGKKLPPSLDAAMKLVDSFDLYPSAIVHSGHGLQAYWFFKTPIIIKDQYERDKTSDLTRGWEAAIRHAAEQHGWTVDSVADLARVFRVPGTMNLKATPIPTKILHPREGDEPDLYSTREIKKFVIAPSMTTAAKNANKGCSQVEVVTPKENPDIIRRIKMLCEISPKLQKTWDRKRTDMPDSSASSYDMAMANALVAAGATDQEVADAILAWRIKHNVDTNKAMRRDYIMSTIDKAKTAFGTEQAITAIGNAEDRMVSIHDDDDKDDIERKQSQNRKIMLQFISESLGSRVQVKRVLQYGRENSTWSLELVDGTDIFLGDKDTAFQQSKFRTSIAQATQFYPFPMNALQWAKFMNGIMAASEIIENVDSSRESIVLSYLRQYTDNVELGGDWRNEFTAGGPFIRKFLKGEFAGQDILCIQSENFLKYINTNSGVKSTRPALHDMLRIAGFTSMPLSVRSGVDTKQVHRKLWIAPVDILQENSKK